MMVPFNLFRFVLIGLVFVWINPQLLLVEDWLERPEINLLLIAMYYFFAVSIEVHYRAILWRYMEPRRDWVVVPAPKLCCNRWISLVEALPPIGEVFEAYCISGVTLPAFVSVKNGGLELTLQSEYAGELERYDPNSLRPTYWRSFPATTNMEAF